jgi:hypothetical protein
MQHHIFAAIRRTSRAKVTTTDFYYLTNTVFLFNIGKNGALHAQEPGRDDFVFTIFSSVI